MYFHTAYLKTAMPLLTAQQANEMYLRDKQFRAIMRFDLVLSIKRCTVSPDDCDQSDWVPSWAMTTLDNSPSSLPNSSRRLELRLFSMNHKHSVKCLFKKCLGKKSVILICYIISRMSECPHDRPWPGTTSKVESLFTLVLAHERTWWTRSIISI